MHRTVFERGVDFELVRKAMERATALLEICGGEAGEICETSSETHLLSQYDSTSP